MRHRLIYANRYLVEFNFGYNGTERLKESRFEFFPAVASTASSVTVLALLAPL